MTDEETDTLGVGIALTPELLDTLDAKVDQYEERSGDPVTRSAVARDALQLGLAAMDVIDDHEFYAPMVEKKSLTRQAMLDHFRNEPDE